MFPITDRFAGTPPGGKKAARSHQGFTLIELLISMAVLALVMLLTVQMVVKTTSITTASNKQMDTASLARVALDRIGEDLSNAALSGSTTALYYSGSPGAVIDPSLNSALGFICKSRARKPVDISSDAGKAAVQDVRGIIVGYKIRPASVALASGSTVNLPLISRGDAVFTFLSDGTTGSDKYGFSVWNLFGITGTKALPTDLTTVVDSPSATTDTSLLSWQGFGDGIVRLHVSFVLDDGRIVQNLQQPNATPPLNATYQNFPSNGGTGDCLPIAFSASNSADVNKRYVTALIVGIAILDQTTINQSYAQNSSFIAVLSGELKRPVNDGETPLSIWQSNLTNVTSPAIRQNIRFQQRFFSVNL